MNQDNSNPISRILNPSTNDNFLTKTLNPPKNNNPLSKILNPSNNNNPLTKILNPNTNEDVLSKSNNFRGSQNNVVTKYQNFEGPFIKASNPKKAQHDATSRVQRSKNLKNHTSSLQKPSSSDKSILLQSRNSKVDKIQSKTKTDGGETLDEFCSRKVSEAREARDARDMKVEAAIRDLQNGVFSCVAEAARAYNLKEKSLRTRVKASGLQLPLNPWQNERR